MCQAELVHETIILFSCVPIIASVWFGALPVFVITNFPGLFLMGELSVPMAVWGVAAPIVFFLIARAVWNQAVKNYTSAST